MANFKKVFNFREGLQASDQSLVVNGSLVGIGTSIPTKFLDVRSESAFSGLSTFSEIRVGGGASFETGVGKSVIVGNFEFNNGIMTAFTGVVSYFGDGSQLSNLPTSQWVDVDTGIGVSSVYNGGNVGISTLLPQYQLQVGGNPEQGFDGIGMQYGNIYVSAAITATRFAGSGTFITDLDADELTSGIVTQARIPRLELDKLPLVPDFKLVQDQQLSGVVTALGGFIGSVTPEPGRDSEARIFANTVIESGISTFNEGEFKGTLTAVASTARTLTGTPDIRVGFVSANTVDAGIALTVNRADIYGDLSVGKIAITDGTDSFKVGTGGSIFNITDGGVGIGTTDPQSSLVLFQQQGTNLEILTETGAATLNLGGDLGIGNSTAELRQEVLRLELSNYANGDYIYHLGRQIPNANLNGNFRWLRGDGGEEKMTFTKDGYLGIGITNPDRPLQSVGNAKIDGQLLVTGDSQFDQDVIIYRGITFNNDANNGVSTAYAFDILHDFNVSGNSVFTGLVDLPDNVTIANNTGVSTFATLDILSALNITPADFNYNTTTGITTVADFNIVGDLTTAVPQNLNFATLSGVSTFFKLDISSDVLIGAALTCGNFQCHVTETGDAGVSTFNALELTASLSVAERLTASGDLSVSNDLFVGGITTLTGAVKILGDLETNTVSGIATLNDIDCQSIVGTSASFTQIENDVTFNDNIVVGTPGSGSEIGAGISVTGSTVAIFGGPTIKIGVEPTTPGDISTGDFGDIGFSTNTPTCAVDVGLRTDSFILPPKCTTVQRNYNTSVSSSRVVDGAVIYNVDTDTLETYADGAWVQLVKQTSGNQITVSVTGSVLTFTDATGGVSTSFTMS